VYAVDSPMMGSLSGYRVFGTIAALSISPRSDDFERNRDFSTTIGFQKFASP